MTAHQPLVAALLLAMAGAPAQDASKLILSYKDYAKIRHGVPYVLAFKSGKGSLLLYGGRHIFDPGDPQVADIEKEWKAFRPTLALNEGGNPPTEAAARTAIERYGEPGLVRFLARRDTVPVATFEPQRADEARGLLRTYSPEQVKVFLVVRGYLSFRRSKRNQTAERYIENALRDPVWKSAGITSGPRSVVELEASCKKLLGKDVDWRTVPDDWFDPTQSGHFTNEAQNDSGMIRDQHIFATLVERVRAGERVFAVIGASHVPVLEPALVATLGPPSRKRDGR